MYKSTKLTRIIPNPKSSSLWKNCRIGLMGGSFDPSHKGHVHLAMQALNKLKLDYVWWLFTPQNPIKQDLQEPSIEKRIITAQNLFQHPKMIYSNIEEAYGTRFTYETIMKAKQTFPNTDFIWIAGMDNTKNFHKWEKWQGLVKEMPIAFFTRPPIKQTIKQTPLKMYQHVKNIYRAPNQFKKGHIYWILLGPTIKASSTQIRESLP